MNDLPYLPLAELPEGGKIPSRLSPKAVILLARLAAHKPVYRGTELAPYLLALADELNNALAPAARVSPDDPRRDELFDGFSERAIVEMALCARGTYITPHEVNLRSERRQRAYSSLELYHAWSYGIWVAADRAAAEQSQVQPAAATTNDPAPMDDPGERTLGLILHRLASLQILIEGWERLDLSDGVIDAHLREGGSEDEPGTHRYRLKRLRHAVFHYQPEHSESAKFAEFWDNGTTVGVWTIGLGRAFDGYFRRMRANHLADLHDWLHADGVAPTI